MMKHLSLIFLSFIFLSSSAFAQIIEAGLSNDGGTVTVSSTNSDGTALTTGPVGGGGSGIQNLNIYVTLKYSASYGVTVSAPTNHNGLNFSLQTTATDNGFTYKLYVASYIGVDPPNIAWTANGADTIDLFSVSISGGSGTGTFEIGNDAFTSTVGGGGDYYFEEATDYTGGLYDQSIGGVPLPVSLTYFGAFPENVTDAKLTWQTATEENNRGFYIERSINGHNWEVVNFTPSLAPGGNSDILVDYQYTDINVYKSWTGISTYYYRLRQQDINGEEEYVGGTKAVRFNEDGAVALVKAYPNPAVNAVNIEVKDGAPMQYTVVDMSGKSVMGGSYSPSLDVSGLQSGNYQLIVTDITGARLGTQNIIIAR